MELNNKSLQQLDEKYYLQTYKRFPIALVKGEGVHVWDADGNVYIDALAGIAVSALGHKHPALVKAIKEQAEKILHISNFYTSIPQVQLSKKLVELSGLSRVFMSNSGTESVEGAFKLARKYAHSKGRGGEIISFEGSFHGRTLAAIASGKKQMQQGFEPIPTGFKQVPFNDIHAVKQAVSKETAAIIVEPIQGEGGINVVEKAFAEELRALCDANDIVLIFDEIQCGIGRTGKMFAFEHLGVKPDIMTLAKALGGGVPIGAILANQKVSDAIDYGDHGTTFGGNPLASAAAMAVLETIESENLVEEARKKGEWIKQQIENINHPDIKEVRGKGLMLGIEFTHETKPLVQQMMNNGVLANATAGNVLRLVPPLTISQGELEQVIDILKQSLNEIKNNA